MLAAGFEACVSRCTTLCGVRGCCTGLKWRRDLRGELLQNLGGVWALPASIARLKAVFTPHINQARIQGYLCVSVDLRSPCQVFVSIL